MSAPSTRPLERLTLDGTLAAVAPHVPAPLVPADDWAAVRRAARMLPAALTRAFYLETRLGRAGGPVDLIVRVERDGAALLAGLNPAVRPPPALREDAAWRAVADLCVRWLTGGGSVARLVSHLWLELDLSPGAAQPIPAPSVFAGLAPAAQAGMTDGDAGALLDWLGSLVPGGLHAATRRTVGRRMADAPGQTVPYIGVMAAREVPAVRVYHRGPQAREVIPSLAAAGWPGPMEPLRDAIDVLAALPGAPGIGMVHVDVAGAPLPRAGVEFAFAREPQVRGWLVETAFLDRLVEMGLCTPDRCDGLRSWPGTRYCSLPHELWESVMVRRVNCVKLVSGPDGMEAKGYLLAFTLPAPARRATIRPGAGVIGSVDV